MANTPSSTSPSRASTPHARFTAQAPTAEDVLKEQTVGLVHLSDFRKRRAEALEQQSRDATPVGGGSSGATTPDARDPAAETGFKKKKRKGVKMGGLSFGEDDEEGPPATKGSSTPNDATEAEEPTVTKKRLKPNAALSTSAPQARTKPALLREAQLRESLRKEYAQVQEAVKATEFCLPFVFFAGKNSPGGMCRMKKGDLVWLFLERARKVGAGLGDGSKRDWARIGVDDLMLVRGDMIVPHHYDFHHFIVNKTTGYNKTPIFPHSSEPTSATPAHLLTSPDGEAASKESTPSADVEANHLTTAAQRAANRPTSLPNSSLEGYADDPALTRVVDRRWYERNKHIYPASVWEEFDAAKDYSNGARKDGEGNAFFFSR